MHLSQSTPALLDPPIDRIVGAAASVSRLALSVHEDLGSVAGVWRELEARGAATPFQAFGWHVAWQRQLGDPQGVRPAIVVGRDRGRVVMVAPFAVERDRFLTRLVWHASALCDYNAPLLAADYAAHADPAAFRADFADMLALIAARPGLAFDAVSLTKMPETVGGRPNPFLALPTTLNPSGAHLTALAGDWDAFYAARRSASTRRRDRTKRRRLGEIGAVSLQTAETPEEVDATLDTLFAQKSAQLAAMGVPDVFADPRVRAFFRDVAAHPETRDLVHVSRLDVGGRPAAVNLGLVHGGTYAHVLASHETGETARFGAGTAHLQALIAWAIGHGCHTFDFTIGDEPYKREWSDAELRLHDYRSAVNARGWLATAPASVAARIKRLVKQTPAIWRLAVAVRALIATRKNAGPRSADRDGE